jgi:hypothetical protein
MTLREQGVGGAEAEWMARAAAEVHGRMQEATPATHAAETAGTNGASARSVVGVASLPLSMPVQLEVTLEVKV